MHIMRTAVRSYGMIQAKLHFRTIIFHPLRGSPDICRINGCRINGLSDYRLSIPESRSSIGFRCDCNDLLVQSSLGKILFWTGIVQKLEILELPVSE